MTTSCGSANIMWNICSQSRQCIESILNTWIQQDILFVVGYHRMKMPQSRVNDFQQNLLMNRMIDLIGQNILDTIENMYSIRTRNQTCTYLLINISSIVWNNRFDLIVIGKSFASRSITNLQRIIHSSIVRMMCNFVRFSYSFDVFYDKKFIWD
jgi:hypothetical protein